MNGTSTKLLYLIAGEPSGDLHGSKLASQLLTHHSDIVLRGVAGPKMRSQGVSGPLQMEDFEVMGFTDVLKALPRLVKHFYTVRDDILDKAPDGVVMIDYPGFNLRMAKALRKKGYKGKLIHYVSPSVWAWGRHRIKEMEQTLDLLLTIYPFEAACYAGSSLNVAYVGSPIKQYIGEYTYNKEWKSVSGITAEAPIVALFPGSRSGELKRNLPMIFNAASILKNNHPDLAFAVSCANEEARLQISLASEVFPELEKSLFPIAREYTYELMRDSRCAIAKSGTVTLELALHKCPTVVVYQLSRLNHFYAKYCLKLNLPHYAIVNILAGKELFPELIEHGQTAENIARTVDTLLNDPLARTRCVQGCTTLSDGLGPSQASTAAAHAIKQAIGWS